MLKRKGHASAEASEHRRRKSDDSSEDDTDMLDVEFEWFDPQEVDFHGIKQLLKQLFDVDHEAFDLSALADLIISQPLLGSTVKVSDDANEAKDNDPFAFLTVVNLHTHRDNPAIMSLVKYLSSKASKMPNLSLTLPPLLSLETPPNIGLILTERFINMPAQIVPPMYNMLLEEIAWAVQEKEPYSFSHYLILSKTYTEIASTMPSMDDEDEGESQPVKKKKKKQKHGADIGESGEVFYFHPEDEVLQRNAVGSGGFRYDKEGSEGASDAKRAFHEAGIKPLGHMILIEASKFERAVKDVGEYLNG
ncbi:MAG: Mss4p nuclear export [Chrysothrix sp. TS-e1954]|nr:MAG: Mss4p nuclear export [Chrysothrix sp. TS-e1954]